MTAERRYDATQPLLFSNDIWQDVKARLGNKPEIKQLLNNAITQITPVRNEIAHVREVSPVLAMIARA